MPTAGSCRLRWSAATDASLNAGSGTHPTCHCGARMKGCRAPFGRSFRAAQRARYRTGANWSRCLFSCPRAQPEPAHPLRPRLAAGDRLANGRGGGRYIPWMSRVGVRMLITIHGEDGRTRGDGLLPAEVIAGRTGVRGRPAPTQRFQTLIDSCRKGRRTQRRSQASCHCWRLPPAGLGATIARVEVGLAGYDSRRVGADRKGRRDGRPKLSEEMAARVARLPRRRARRRSRDDHKDDQCPSAIAEAAEHAREYGPDRISQRGPPCGNAGSAPRRSEARTAIHPARIAPASNDGTYVRR
jgi:hypothetical protein